METPTTTTKKPGILINRNFGLLWSGQAISIIGDFAFESALVLWISFQIAKGQSWAPLAVSGVLIATSLPMLLIRPLAGVFVDRWDKRRTMLRMDLIRAILVAALILATGIVALPGFAAGQLPFSWKLGAIYLVVFLTYTCAMFFNPSRLALTGDIVPETLRGRAFGLDYTTENLAIVIGPPIAAALFLFGIHWALLVNALSFLVSFVNVAGIRPPAAARSVAPGERGHAGREFREGWRFFTHNRVLVSLTVSFGIIMLGLGCINALLVFFVQRNLHGSPATYAQIMAAVGLGAIGGAALATWVMPRVGAGRCFWLACMAMGVDVVALARLTSVIPALILAALAGIIQAFANVAQGPIVLQVTPRELVGRISSLLNPALTAMSLLSLALAGALASTALRGFHQTIAGIDFGPIDTIFTASGLLAIVGGVYAMFNLRGLDGVKGEASDQPTS